MADAERRVISLPLDSGADGASDPKISGPLIHVVNARWERRYRISKRLGQTQLGGPSTFGGVVTRGKRLFRWRDSVFNLGEKLQCYQAAQNTWTDGGTAAHYRFGRYSWRPLPVSRPTLVGRLCDIAELGNIYAVAYVHTTTGFMTLETYDRTTHTRITSISAEGASAVRGFKLVALPSASRIMLYWHNSTPAFGFKAVSSTTGLEISSGFGTPPTPSLHATYPAADACMVVNGGSNRAVFVLIDVNGDVHAIIHDGAAAWTSLVVKAIAADDARLVGCWQQSDTRWGLTYVINGSGTWRAVHLDLSGAFVTAEITIVPPGAGGQVKQVTGCVSAIVAGNSHVFMARNAPDNWTVSGLGEAELLYHHYDASGTGSSVLARRQWLAGKAAPRGASASSQVQYLLPTCVRNTIIDQAKATDTVLVVDDENLVVARAAIERANLSGDYAGGGGGGPGGVNISDHLCNFDALVAGTGLLFCVPTLIDADFRVAPGAAGSLASLNRMELYTPTLDNERLAVVDAQDDLILANGCPQLFDGATVGEQGFHWYPGFLELLSSAAGAVTAGERRYKACYARVDGQGRVARSIATPLPLVVTFAANTKKTIRLGAYQTTRWGDTWIELYRTKASGTAYYLVARIAQPAVATNWKVDYEDNATDAAIEDNELLYTDEEEADEPARAHEAACSWDNRHWLYDIEGRMLRYSKALGPGLAVAHATSHVVQPDVLMGDVVAMAALGDKMPIWTADQLWIQEGAGLGRNPAGLGQNYPRPWLLNPGVGCLNQLTLVRVPNGWMFQGTDGMLWMLTNALEVVPMVAARHLVDGVILQQGMALPAQHLAIWTGPHHVEADFSPAIVYDWLHDQWSRWNNWGASGCVQAGGIAYRWDESLGFFKMGPNIGDDASGLAHVPLRIISGWMPVNGLLGNGGCSRVLILGQNITAHSLRVRVGFNYDPIWPNNHLFPAHALTEFAAADYYTLGSSLEHQALIVEVQPKTFPVTAVRVAIEDEQTGPEAGQPYGEAWSLSAIALEVTSKDGSWQVGATRRRTETT